jgi:FkbM family methyltransferase
MYGMIFTHGAYEPANTAVLETLLRTGDFVVDVGANHGWFALSMAQTVGETGKVWAYEPTPPIYDDLLRNLDQNRSLRVDARPRGLGMQEATTDIYLFTGLPHGHASQSSLGRTDHRTFSIPLVTLDSELKHEPTAPVLVKLDVEGAELQVLQGAKRLLQRAPPIWVVEVNWATSHAFQYGPPEIVAELTTSSSYNIFRVVGGMLAPETDASAAPQDTTWVCVPDALMTRAQGLIGDETPTRP